VCFFFLDLAKLKKENEDLESLIRLNQSSLAENKKRIAAAENSLVVSADRVAGLARHSEATLKEETRLKAILEEQRARLSRDENERVHLDGVLKNLRLRISQAVADSAAEGEALEDELIKLKFFAEKLAEVQFAIAQISEEYALQHTRFESMADSMGLNRRVYEGVSTLELG
jgi:chromosome segregation ATPase